MAIPCLTAVVSSARYWPKPPSPETETTLRPLKSGSSSRVAAQAPIAAGKLNPIDPRYPDIKIAFGGVFASLMRDELSGERAYATAEVDRVGPVLRGYGATGKV